MQNTKPNVNIGFFPDFYYFKKKNRKRFSLLVVVLLMENIFSLLKLNGLKYRTYSFSAWCSLKLRVDVFF